MESNPYKSPASRDASPPAEPSAFRQAIVTALAQQVLLLLLAALMLDGGRFLRSVTIGIAVSWLVILPFAIRRRANPGRLGVLVVKYGFWLFVLLLLLLDL